jgi:hypothetical protein
MNKVADRHPKSSTTDQRCIKLERFVKLTNPALKVVHMYTPRAPVGTSGTLLRGFQNSKLTVLKNRFGEQGVQYIKLVLNRIKMTNDDQDPLVPYRSILWVVKVIKEL